MTTPPRNSILIIDRFAPEVQHALQAQGPFQVQKISAWSDDDAETVVRAQEAEGLVIRSTTKITGPFLSRFPRLRVIITCTSGFDHIDFEACAERGIQVMYTPEAHVASAAELTWGLLLACVRKIAKGHAQIKAGLWRRDLAPGSELEGKTLGIVGLGRIGQRVAGIAQAFGLRTLAYDPFLENEVFLAHRCERISYEELLKLSDIVTYHVPQTKYTKRMLQRALLEQVHHGLIVLNVSRGSVIAEEDLVEALQKGWISAAGLDVFEKEPLPRTSALLKLDNVVLTPHIGAVTNEALQKSSQMAAQKLRNFFLHGEVSDSLPPSAPWYGSPTFIPG
jgi:D-3-phosphoglycerate dehydrogenase